ncbi:MAG: hypothetical protein WC007_12950, partial [Pelobacteraceae bacterium]
MHHIAVAKGDTNQVAHLHLAEAERHVFPVDLPARLDDPGTLADAAMPDHAGGQVGLGDDFLDDGLHLFDVHVRLQLTGQYLSRWIVAANAAIFKRKLAAGECVMNIGAYPGKRCMRRS